MDNMSYDVFKEFGTVVCKLHMLFGMFAPKFDISISDWLLEYIEYLRN